MPRLPMMNLFQRILVSFAAAIFLQGILAGVFMVGFIERVQSENARKELAAEARAVFAGLSAWKLELWKKINDLEGDEAVRRAVAASGAGPLLGRDTVEAVRSSLAGTSVDTILLKSEGEGTFRFVSVMPGFAEPGEAGTFAYDRNHPYVDVFEARGEISFMGAARVTGDGGRNLDVFLFKKVGGDLLSALSFNPRIGIVVSAGFGPSTASHSVRGRIESDFLAAMTAKKPSGAAFVMDDWGGLSGPFGFTARQCGTVRVGSREEKFWVSTLLSKAEYRDGITRLNVVLLLVLALVALLTILVSAAISRSIASPVKSLCRGMRGVRDGVLDETEACSGITEIEELLRGFDSMTQKLKADKAEIELSIARTVQAEKLASVGMLSAGVAHEVNNPLGSILSNVQNLIAEEGDPEKREILGLVERETKRIARIVRALLDFSSPRTGGDVDPTCRPVSVITEIISLLRYSLKNNREVSVFSEFEDGEIEIAMSSDELKQVLLNLIRNSFHAIGQEGTVLVSVKKGADGGDAGGLSGTAVIEVSDSGPGIPHELLPRIFDPFFSTKTGGEGVGLGLSVVYGIVTERKGHIRAESETGKGTRIIMEIPLAPGRGGKEGAD